MLTSILRYFNCCYTMNCPLAIYFYFFALYNYKLITNWQNISDRIISFTSINNVLRNCSKICERVILCMYTYIYFFGGLAHIRWSRRGNAMETPSRRRPNTTRSVVRWCNIAVYVVLSNSLVLAISQLIFSYDK